MRRRMVFRNQVLNSVLRVVFVSVVVAVASWFVMFYNPAFIPLLTRKSDVSQTSAKVSPQQSTALPSSSPAQQYRRRNVSMMYAYQDRKELENRPSIFFLGDSITAYGVQEGGYVSIIASRYVNRSDVIARGYPGYNTRWILEGVLDSIFQNNPGLHPDLAVVFFGANDACIPETPQHVPLEEYVSNLRKIVESIQIYYSERNATHRKFHPSTKPPYIIFISPPPVVPDHWVEKMKEMGRYTGVVTRDLETTRMYARAVVQLGESMNIPVLDFNSYCLQFDKSFKLEHPPPKLVEPGCESKYAHISSYRELLSDGLHLNDVGNQYLADKLMELIQAKIPEMYYESLPLSYRDWSEFAGIPFDPKR